MGTIILILFIIFVVWPLCKLIWRGYQVHQQWKKATEGMRDAFNQSRQPGSNGQRQQGAKRGRKKKIDPNVGEYVAFEEISCNVNSQSTTDASGQTHTRTESQVEDAVWEEIKE